MTCEGVLFTTVAQDFCEKVTAAVFLLATVSSLSRPSVSRPCVAFKRIGFLSVSVLPPKSSS